jgi:hypothetical protein
MQAFSEKFIFCSNLGGSAACISTPKGGSLTPPLGKTLTFIDVLCYNT